MEAKNQIFDMIEPSKNLKSSIMFKIRKEEIKIAIYKIVAGSVASLASISVAIIFLLNIVNDAHQSGLSDYLSLLLSDGASLLSYWQSYAMSVLESLPIIPIAIVVASIGVFVWSVNMALTNLKNTKSVFTPVK